MIQGIEVDGLYKYPQLCKILGQETKSSNSKKAQLHAWKNAFDFEFVTKQVIKITKIIDLNADISVKNGGVRENSGRKSKLQSEFDALFNMFLHYNFNKNVYKGQPNLCDVHATTAYMQRYFGIYS